MMDFRVEKSTGVLQTRSEVTKATEEAGTPLQLKVCEACGGLWLKAAEQGVYCRKCAEWLAEMPVLRPEGRRGRRRRRRGSGPGFQKPQTVPASQGGAS